MPYCQADTMAPDLWRFEKTARSRGFSSIAGIDEAGRGPLAGPVVAAAVIFPENLVIPDGIRRCKRDGRHVQQGGDPAYYPGSFGGEIIGQPLPLLPNGPGDYGVIAQDHIVAGVPM